MTARSRALVLADRARQFYWRLIGPRTLGVRIVVRDGDGRFLLVRHSYGAGDWLFPGGGVHRRERIDAAARREAHEETGVLIPDAPGALLLVGVFSNLREGKSDHVVVFEAVEWYPASEPSDDPEIAETGWFAPDDLPARTSPATRRRIAELGSGTPPGFGW